MSVTYANRESSEHSRPQRNADVVDETTPLITESIPPTTRQQNEDEENGDIDLPELKKATEENFIGIIAVLLIGVFISQTDFTLVLAAYGQISSEFDALEGGSWLLSTYMLAMCVAQPLYGKISDIYGRKRCLQAAYGLFAVGTAVSGVGQSLAQVIVGRAIQGAGGAGMVSMVSILLTDLIPMHEVAVYRSYINVVQTIGRSCGGAIGGFLVQTIGWRWAFLCQVPPILVAMILVQWRLPSQTRGLEDGQTMRARFARIDFLGAASLSVTILAIMLIIDTAGRKFAWNHPVTIASICIGFVGAVLFGLIEEYWAKEPIFPLNLLSKRAVVSSFSVLALQFAAQTCLVMVIPMYFQVTNNASTAKAGAYLIPTVIGNTVGGLLSGAAIKRTGRYKYLITMASVCSLIAFALMIGLWRGKTDVGKSLVVFPGGFATGIAYTSVFVALTSGVSEAEIPIAASGLYLSGNVGCVAGISASDAVYQATLQRGLMQVLNDRNDRDSIIENALSDISFIQNTSDELRRIMIPAYVDSFRDVFFMGLGCAAIALVIGLGIKEKRLRS